MAMFATANLDWEIMFIELSLEGKVSSTFVCAVNNLVNQIHIAGMED